jgi:adenylylsulfate kinase
MEGTRKRSAVKSITWRIICIVVSVFTTFFVSGNWDIAVAVGTAYNVITMILYYFHERIWSRIKWALRSNTH